MTLLHPQIARRTTNTPILHSNKVRNLFRKTIHARMDKMTQWQSFMSTVSAIIYHTKQFPIPLIHYRMHAQVMMMFSFFCQVDVIFHSP